MKKCPPEPQFVPFFIGLILYPGIKLFDQGFVTASYNLSTVTEPREP